MLFSFTFQVRQYNKPGRLLSQGIVLKYSWAIFRCPTCVVLFGVIYAHTWESWICEKRDFGVTFSTQFLHGAHMQEKLFIKRADNWKDFTRQHRTRLCVEGILLSLKSHSHFAQIWWEWPLSLKLYFQKVIYPGKLSIRHIHACSKQQQHTGSSFA